MSDWKPYAGMVGRTPYSDWRIMTDSERYFRGETFDRDRLARAFRIIDENRASLIDRLDALRARGIYISSHFLGDQARSSGSAIAYGPSGQIEAVLRDLEITNVEFGPLVDADILRDPPSDEPPEPAFARDDWDDKDTLCAIIDDSIGFANARFRKSLTETRIEALWIMDGKGGPAIPHGLHVFGGLVLFRDQIDALLRQFACDGVVDEAALYRHLDAVHDAGLNPLPRATHGTHVLDLFAGAKMGAAPAAEGARPIIAVVLPQLAVRDTSGTHSEFFVQEAVAWINAVADRFRTAQGNPVKLVTNFSFGLTAGPHDGHSTLERSLATIPARAGPSAAVLPAGNSHESRTHALAEVTPNAPDFSIAFEISPLNRLSTFIEIWRPAGAPRPHPGLTLTLDTPLGRLEERNPAFDGGFEWCPDGHVSLRTYHQSAPRPDPNAPAREVATIAVLPADTFSDVLPTAPAGRWTLTLRCDCTEKETIPLWIQRGGSVFGHPALGRQTRFAEGQTGIRTLGTLNALATAAGVVSVGGYVHSGTFPPADYSSAGSPIFPVPLPDVAAPSDESHWVSGISATGTFSGAWARLSGTSVATPQVARRLADSPFGADAKAFLADYFGQKPSEDRYRLGLGRLFLAH